MTAAQATPREQPFHEWLDEDVELHIAVKRENDQWYALLLEFDITGTGPTRATAVQDAFSLLGPYLCAYFEDGVPFAAAFRPIPRKLRARIFIETTIARTVRSLAPRLPLADESTYALPPGLLRFAH